MVKHPKPELAGVSSTSQWLCITPPPGTLRTSRRRSNSESVVFTGPLSDGLRRATLQKAWDQARRTAGLADVHLHDLRHAAGTLAAQTGATTHE